MDHATVEKNRPAYMRGKEAVDHGGETLQSLTEPEAPAKARAFVEDLQDWPEGSYWKQVSELSEPTNDGTRAVVWLWWLPSGWSGYTVFWHRHEEK